jgi:hypothetical protein
VRIARCTPSRGLVHSRTEEAADLARMWAESHGHTWRNVWTNDLPIPACFNRSVGTAYNLGADLVWILEEDVVPEPGAFGWMVEAIEAGADVSVVDYVMKAPGRTTISWGVQRDGAGAIAWARTGCILFKRECLDRLPYPWFTLYGRILRRDGTIDWQSDVSSLYGVDVEFTYALVQLGFEFHEVKAHCDHLKIVEWGQSGQNDGRHTIAPVPTVPKLPNRPPRRRTANGSSNR